MCLCTETSLQGTLWVLGFDLYSPATDPVVMSGIPQTQEWPEGNEEFLYVVHRTITLACYC